MTMFIDFVAKLVVAVMAAGYERRSWLRRKALK